MKKAFPGASVASKRVDEYPIYVQIEAEVPDEDAMLKIWKGDQRGLFRKNGHRAVPEITAALERLKAKLEALTPAPAPPPALAPASAPSPNQGAAASSPKQGEAASK